MKSSQKNILSVLLIIACLLLLAAGYYGTQAYQFYATRPLGPALPASTPLSLPATWTVTVGTPLSAATPTPQPFCGGPKVMTILALGMDRYGDTDIIRVVRADFVTPKVTILEFPRDLWVEIPYIADNQDGLDHAKLNMAYFFGSPEQDYWDDPSGGPGLLSLTLDINFG
ncbi:MAG: hypothetical protein MUO77_09530, partial [Anaerolineales bacterium]|nr:hypothetical protein [Anaerolineales bacterium]